MHASSSPTTANLPKRELLKDKSAIVSRHLPFAIVLPALEFPSSKCPKILDLGSAGPKPGIHICEGSAATFKAIGEETKNWSMIHVILSCLGLVGLQHASGPMNRCSAWEDVITERSLEKPCHAPSVRRNWHPAFPNFPEHHIIQNHTTSKEQLHPQLSDLSKEV